MKMDRLGAALFVMLAAVVLVTGEPVFHLSPTEMWSAAGGLLLAALAWWLLVRSAPKRIGATLQTAMSNVDDL